MKLHKQLTINGEPVALNADDVRLSLAMPGRAVFTITAAATRVGIVKYSAGFAPELMQTIFCGYIENSFAIDAKQQRLFCRELTATLNRLVPLAMRNANLNDVLMAISKETALEFVTPDQPYATTKAPAFYSLGTGYYCMDALAQVYQIPNLIWQQQGDGQVFVGSWEDSYWGKPGRIIELPTKWQEQQGVANRAQIPLVPKLRPGVRLSTGHTITHVHIDGVHMAINWHKNPWGTEWTNRSSV